MCFQISLYKYKIQLLEAMLLYLIQYTCTTKAQTQQMQASLFFTNILQVEESRPLMCTICHKRTLKIVHLAMPNQDVEC